MSLKAAAVREFLLWQLQDAYGENNVDVVDGRRDAIQLILTDGTFVTITVTEDRPAGREGDHE